jgi:hypothetical protein
MGSMAVPTTSTLVNSDKHDDGSFCETAQFKFSHLYGDDSDDDA